MEEAYRRRGEEEEDGSCTGSVEEEDQLTGGATVRQGRRRSCINSQLARAALSLEVLLAGRHRKRLRSGWNVWCEHVRQYNEPRMLEDRQRWVMHAVANSTNDLQAWYHSVFYREVYRLRGHFWFKDACLPRYSKSYRLSQGGALSPMEKAVLGGVLCSKATTYTDVQQHMYTAEGVLDGREYSLFAKLTRVDVPVERVPSSSSSSSGSSSSSSSSGSKGGRKAPSYRDFRLSFVGPSMFLTWKGRQGTSGVNLADVIEVRRGLNTSNGKPHKRRNSRDGQQQDQQPRDKEEEQYWKSLPKRCLSLILPASRSRSLDLCLVDENERDSWCAMLRVLVALEQGKPIPGGARAEEEEQQQQQQEEQEEAQSSKKQQRGLREARAGEEGQEQQKPPEQQQRKTNNNSSIGAGLSSQTVGRKSSAQRMAKLLDSDMSSAQQQQQQPQPQPQQEVPSRRGDPLVDSVLCFATGHGY